MIVVRWMDHNGFLHDRRFASMEDADDFIDFPPEYVREVHGWWEEPKPLLEEDEVA